MSSIQMSAQILKDVLSRKNSDYTTDRGEFYNFEQASRFGGYDSDPLRIMLSQIAIKYTRIDSLNDNPEAANCEPLKDSLLDLAGYAVIAHAYLSAEERIEGHICTRICDHEGCPG